MKEGERARLCHRTLVGEEGSVGDRRGDRGVGRFHAYHVLAVVQLAVELRAGPGDRLLTASDVREGDGAGEALPRKVDASTLELDANLDHPDGALFGLAVVSFPVALLELERDYAASWLVYGLWSDHVKVDEPFFALPYFISPPPPSTWHREWP